MNVRKRSAAKPILLTLAAISAATLAPLSARAALDGAKIDQLTGLSGAMSAKEGVYKVSYPRKDLRVTAAGVRVTPAMGLTAWAAFSGEADHVMVMGDIVMTEDQVNPVMSAALGHGLEVTALHNHFFGESPRIMFMHVGGMGTQEAMASAVGAVFGELKATAGGKGSFPHASIDPAKSTLHPQELDKIFGKHGEYKDGVYKLTFDRATQMGGHEARGAMGVNTWAAFAGSDEQAVVDGDFAMLGSELQDVLKALRKAGIDVVAIHNHMVGEEPRIVFLHYWGVGHARELAQGLKSALAVVAR